MPESLRGFYSKAEAQGAVFQVMYVYPAAEYDRIKAGLTSALRREFKSVEAKEYDSKQYDLETDTILFEKKTQHRKRCVGIIHRRSEHIKFHDGGDQVQRDVVLDEMEQAPDACAVRVYYVA